jgi:hypothetical protein
MGETLQAVGRGKMVVLVRWFCCLYGLGSFVLFTRRDRCGLCVLPSLSLLFEITVQFDLPATLTLGSHDFAIVVS